MSADQAEASRSGRLLAAGLRALEHGDREQAAAYLAALYREGHALHYRELAGAFIAEAAPAVVGAPADQSLAGLARLLAELPPPLPPMPANRRGRGTTLAEAAGGTRPNS